MSPVSLDVLQLQVAHTNWNPSELPLDYMTMIKISIILGMYGLTSSLCNCLVIFTIKKKNRVFLIPYLFFLPLTAMSLFREDIQKKNCRFCENFIIYLTPLPPYSKSEKQKNEILVCLRPPLPPAKSEKFGRF